MPAVAIALAYLVLGVVFRCPSPDDPSVPLFTDRPCVGGATVSDVAPNAIAPAPLTSEERATLERIGKPPRTQQRTLEPDDDRREQRCTAARKGLDDIRATRRHGYRASASARLDASEARLRAEVDATCGIH